MGESAADLRMQGGQHAIVRLARVAGGRAYVRMPPGRKVPDWMRAGVSAAIHTVQPAGVVRLDTEVESVGALICLRISRRARTPLRPRGIRRPCSFPVACRPVRGDGIRGAWVAAEAADLSVDGIGLLFVGGWVPALDVELKFALSSPAPDASRSRGTEHELLAADRLVSANAPITMLARVVHRRRGRNGEVFVGMRTWSAGREAAARVSAFVAAGVATTSARCGSGACRDPHTTS